MKQLLVCAVAVTTVAFAPTRVSAQGSNVRGLESTIQGETQQTEKKLQQIQQDGSALSIGDMFSKHMQQNQNNPDMQNRSQPVQAQPNTQINSMSRNVK